MEKEIESNEKNEKEKWWLKKPDIRLEMSNVPVEIKTEQSPSLSPDVSSSMKEFLEKEKMCKVINI